MRTKYNRSIVWQDCYREHTAQLERFGPNEQQRHRKATHEAYLSVGTGMCSEVGGWKVKVGALKLGFTRALTTPPTSIINALIVAGGLLCDSCPTSRPRIR